MHERRIPAAEAPQINGAQVIFVDEFLSLIKQKNKSLELQGQDPFAFTLSQRGQYVGFIWTNMEGITRGLFTKQNADDPEYATIGVAAWRDFHHASQDVMRDLLSINVGNIAATPKGRKLLKNSIAMAFQFASTLSPEIYTFTAESVKKAAKRYV